MGTGTWYLTLSWLLKFQCSVGRVKDVGILQPRPNKKNKTCPILPELFSFLYLSTPPPPADAPHRDVVLEHRQSRKVAMVRTLWQGPGEKVSNKYPHPSLPPSPLLFHAVKSRNGLPVTIYSSDAAAHTHYVLWMVFLSARSAGSAARVSVQQQAGAGEPGRSVCVRGTPCRS